MLQLEVISSMLTYSYNCHEYAFLIYTVAVTAFDVYKIIKQKCKDKGSSSKVSTKRNQRVVGDQIQRVGKNKFYGARIFNFINNIEVIAILQELSRCVLL